MKLFYSPTSPYARKCRALAIEKGIEGRLEIITASPMSNPPELQAANPLGKVPALVLADGSCIVDSPVICAYLDSLGDTPRLIPADPAARFDALTREALADGIMDAAFAIVMERKRPEPQRSAEWLLRWTSAIRRSVAHFNTRLLTRQQPAPLSTRYGRPVARLRAGLCRFPPRRSCLGCRSARPARLAFRGPRPPKPCRHRTATGRLTQ